MPVPLLLPAGGGSLQAGWPAGLAPAKRLFSLRQLERRRCRLGACGGSACPVPHPGFPGAAGKACSVLCCAARGCTCCARPWHHRAPCPGMSPKASHTHDPGSATFSCPMQSPQEAGSRQASLRRFQQSVSAMCGHLERCPPLAAGLAAGQGSLLELLLQLGCNKAGCPAGEGEQVGAASCACGHNGLVHIRPCQQADCSCAWSLHWSKLLCPAGTLPPRPPPAKAGRLRRPASHDRPNLHSAGRCGSWPERARRCRSARGLLRWAWGRGPPRQVGPPASRAAAAGTAAGGAGSSTLLACWHQQRRTGVPGAAPGGVQQLGLHQPGGQQRARAAVQAVQHLQGGVGRDCRPR